MATNITTGKPLCYEAGASGASYVVGYESKHNRVVRYAFTTGSGGASEISVSIPNYTKNSDSGSDSAPLRFFIGTSPTSHANAGADSEYTGALTMTTAGGYYHFTGTAKIILAPNTTYYLWIFPGSTAYGWWWVASQGTATVTVHTAAMSSFTVSNGTLGQTVPITITRHNSQFTHKLWSRYGTGTWGLIAEGVGTSYDWVPPLSLASNAPSATSFNIEISVDTYLGSTYIGEVHKTITLSIPESVVPSVSMSITDPTGLMLNGKYLQNLSGVQVTLKEITAYGSPIVSRKITIGSVSGGGSSLTVRPIAVSGSVVVSASVTDARGRTDKNALVIQVEPYARPTASVSGQRCNTDGTPDPAGTNILATYSGSYTDLGGDNTAYPVLYYRKSGDTYWSSLDVELSGSSVISAEAAYVYELQFAVEDDYGDPQRSQIFPVPSAFAGVSLAKNADGVIDGISFGGTAHPGSGFVCEMPAHFAIDGNVYDLTDWVIAQGTTDIWSWRKWASGVAECWGRATCNNIVANNEWGSLYTSQDFGPVAYPFSFSDRPTQTFFCSKSSATLFVAGSGLDKSNSISSTGAWFFMRPLSSEINNSAEVDIYVIGRWK